MQVATDTRLWLKNELLAVREQLGDLIKAAVARGEAEVGVLMPGFTHLQPAQTVRWSHWLLGHAAAWQRDLQRLGDLLPRVSMLPLGSGASRSSPAAPSCLASQAAHGVAACGQGGSSWYPLMTRTAYWRPGSPSKSLPAHHASKPALQHCFCEAEQVPFIIRYAVASALAAKPDTAFWPEKSAHLVALVW